MKVLLKAFRNILVFLSLLAALLTAQACPFGEPFGEPIGGPGLEIISPLNGVSVHEGDIKAEIGVAVLRFANSKVKENAPFEGHAIFYLDVDAPSTPNQSAIPVSGTWERVWGTEYVFKSVIPGNHRISVELVNNDDTPFTPPALQSTNIVVTGLNDPGVEIISQKGTLSGIGDFKTSVRVSNFKLAGKSGQANTQGEGHLIYFIDVDAPTNPRQPAYTAPGTYAVSADTSFTWHNFENGRHKLSVELVNSDDTPLVPPIVSSIYVTTDVPIGKPALYIASPKHNTVVLQGPVTVMAIPIYFSMSNSPAAKNPSQRHGYVIYYLDVPAHTARGKPATTAEGTFAVELNFSHTWPSLPSGNHRLSAQLVNDDYTPLVPPVVAYVDIMVK